MRAGHTKGKLDFVDVIYFSSQFVVSLALTRFKATLENFFTEFRALTMEEKAIHVVSFTGNQGKWRKWKLKFLSKALYIGYCDVLLGKDTVPKDSDVLDLTPMLGRSWTRLGMPIKWPVQCWPLHVKKEHLELSKSLCRVSDLPDGVAAMAWKT